MLLSINTSMHLLLHSSLHKGSVAFGRRYSSEWRQSGDMHQQCMGYCVWWFLGEYWCYRGVSTAGILYSRSVTSLCSWNASFISIYQQMQWPLSVSTLVLVLVQSTLTMLPAGVVKVDSLAAHTALIYSVPIRMWEPEWDVKVVELATLLFGDTYHDINYINYSQFKWKLYIWRCSSGGRLWSVWG